VLGAGAAITGMGCVSAYGVGVPELWRGLLANQPAPRVQRKHRDGSPGFSADSPAADVLSSFARASGVSRPTRPAMLARIAAEEAWTSSGMGAEVAPERAGLIVNRNFGQHQVIGQYYEKLWTKGPSAVSGLQFVQTIANSVLGTLAMEFRLRGPSTMHFGAASLGAALDLLRNDAADAILVGGFDELSDYIFEMCHCCSLASSEIAARPYDGASSGLTPGDGSAFFVLERPEHARARGAKPLAYLKGYATVTDRRAVRNPVERDAGDIAEAIRRGLCDADITPEDVSFVSGAGNGYGAFDHPELVAVASALVKGPDMFSVKGGVGETWGASGGISILAAVRALGENAVPPSVGASDSAGSNVVTGKPAMRRPGAAVVLSMEMSGQDSAFVLCDEL
jgi:3-oxoacyl-[acyl-carrier-protein] synthase II